MKKAGKPVRPGEVAKMIGEDSKQVSKAINELKKQGKIVSPKRCFWEPAWKPFFNWVTPQRGYSLMRFF